MNKNFIVSFPKCGRTWLRVAMGKSLVVENGWDRKSILSPPVPDYPLFTHAMDISGNPSIADADSWDTLTGELDSFKGSVVLLLVRNPLDVMVSYFCHRSHREALDDSTGTISEFIRRKEYGLDKLLFFWNCWYGYRESLNKFMVVRYEDMHTDLLSVLRNSFKFFDMGDVAKDSIKEAVRFSQFDNMKKQQDEGYWSSRRMSKGPNPDSAKVRKGIVRGYTDHLDSVDISYAKKRIKAVGCPFYTVDEI